MSSFRSIVSTVAILTVCAASAGASASDRPVLPDEEVLLYRWKLQGIFGTVARMFMPGSGESRITTTQGNGQVVSNLHITASRNDASEFFDYGSEIDPLALRARRAWSSYQFRGRSKEKKAEFGEEGVIDVPSGIYLLRFEPPSEPLTTRIWSDGKIYPVVITPRGRRSRRIAGKSVAADGFAVRGVRVAGERFWKGGLDIWVGTDAAATPIEILFDHKFGRVRLKLLDAMRTSAPAPGPSD